MKSIGIEGAWLRETTVFRDARGSFHDWFQAPGFRDAVGRDLSMRQANCVVSKRGVVRGIHYTADPPGQAKYFTCVRGATLNVVVDVRLGSPTFGEWRAVRLDAEEGNTLYVAEGLGQAFMALSDETTLIYLCSETFRPGRERGIHPLDTELGIRWPEDVAVNLSDRDSGAPTLAEAERQGLLPKYADCMPG
jgi:dTDP-4-dehydrorhamnose 3,5-epimerase